MSSASRKMRRKKVREFSYEKYSKVQTIRNQKRRMQHGIERSRADWKRVISENIPQKQRVFACHIPPHWYIKFLKWAVQYFPPEKLVKFLIDPSRKIPVWIAWMIIGPLWVPALIMEWIGVKPFGIVRRFAMTFPTTTHYRRTLDNEKKEVVQMTIRKWGRIIHQSEYRV